MKNFKRLMCLALVVLMALTCLFACKKKESGDSGDDKNNPVAVEDAWSKLETNVDKFTYGGSYSDKQKDAVMSLIDLPGFDSIVETYNKTDVEHNISLSLDKLEVQGQDMLTQLGGPVNVGMNSIYNKDATQLDFNIGLGGMSMAANVYANAEALVVKIPMLQQNLYFDLNAISEAMKEASSDLGEAGVNNIVGMLQSLDMNAIAEKLEGVLTAENLSYILNLLADCIPEDAITSENVKLEGFKAGYISSIDTECLTLTVTEDVAYNTVANAIKALKDDAKVKEIFVTLFDIVKETGLLDEALDGAELGSGAEFYDNLFFEVQTRFEDVSRDPEVKDQVGFKIKRYFAKGINVKNSLILDKETMDVDGEISFWNIYEGNKNESGLLVSIDGQNVLDAYKGADADKVTGKLTINADGVEVVADLSKDKVDTSIITEIKSEGQTMAKLLVEKNESADRCVINFDLSIDEDEDPSTDMMICTLDFETTKGDKTETAVRLNVPELINAELKLTAEIGKKTDKKVEMPTADGCTKIDSTEALEDLLGGLMGGMGDL